MKLTTKLTRSEYLSFMNCIGFVRKDRQTAFNTCLIDAIQPFQSGKLNWVIDEEEKPLTKRPYAVEPTWMSPDEFLRRATKLPGSLFRRSTIESLKKSFRDKKSVPILWLEKKKGRFTGDHEGRHRAQAAKEAGISHVPVAVENSDVILGFAGEENEKQYAEITIMKNIRGN